MSESPSRDCERFLSHVEAARREDALFRHLYRAPDPAGDGVAALRRHRGRVGNDGGRVMKCVSLVAENGTLYWRDGVPERAGIQERRGHRGAAPDGSLVLTRKFPALAPNTVIAAVGAIDRRLNPAIDASLLSRLRRLRATPSGGFDLQEHDAAGPFSGRTLLFVHGTFSNATHLLTEFTRPGCPGLRLLGRALHGAGGYDQVLFFDHPTLSVSPLLNAIELGRAMAGSSGQIDVVAHSRGGLVARWWLEAFGQSLRLSPGARVRAVLAGAPLHGTSLAAPDRIQHAMSLIANVGTLAEQTLGLAGLSNPFVWVAGKLVEVIVSVAGWLAMTPTVDALTLLLPGFSGQSAADNNLELDRLRRGPAVVEPAYYAIVSNFETEDPAWRFWRNFRKDRAGDVAMDVVFPGENDLAVDTRSMTDFGDRPPTLAGACDYGTTDAVWHSNYFRQERSIACLASWFELGL
jgi:hypothetical protein